MAYFKCKGGLHRWQIWNAVPTYAETSNYSYAQYIRTGSFGGLTVYGRATGYTFDPSTGLFTLTGGENITIPTYYEWSEIIARALTSMIRGCYCCFPGEGNVVREFLDLSQCQNTATKIQAYPGFLYKANGADLYYYHNSYQSGIQKGSTLIGYVYSMNANAHPLNGAENGQWYIKM